MVHTFGRQFCDFLRQCDCRDMRRHEKRVVVRQFLHLAGGHLGHLLTSVANVHAPKACHAVEDFIAFAVRQVHAFGTRNDPCAF